MSMDEPGSAGNAVRARVAVIEDDDILRDEILVPGLAASGYEAEGFGRPVDLYRRMLSTSFDVVVLDVGLPDEDGLSVARYLRAHSSLGIVMLTGHRHLGDRVKSLGEAADAWLSKPIEVEVVAATIRSLLRRMHMPATTSPKPPREDAPAEASWRLMAQGWRLVAPSGREIALNRAERSVLERLFGANGEAVPREMLIDALGESRDEFDPHRIDMLVHRLRRKVSEQVGEELPLRSVRGRGYVLLGGGQR